jgi:hypothetical protein
MNFSLQEQMVMTHDGSGRFPATADLEVSIITLEFSSRYSYLIARFE